MLPVTATIVLLVPDKQPCDNLVVINLNKIDNTLFISGSRSKKALIEQNYQTIIQITQKD